MGAAFRAELTKLLTLRSVVIALALAVTVPVGLAALSAPAVGQALASNDPALAPGVTPAGVGMEFVMFGQIALVVVGVLAASSEYRGGQLLVSLCAVPVRGRLLAAKSLALLLVSLVVSAVAVPTVSLVSQAEIGDLSVIDGGVPTSLLLRWVGGILYWAAIAQLGLALAVLTRSTLLPLVVLIVVSQLSLMFVVLSSWTKLLPTVAGVQLFDPASLVTAYPDAALRTPAAGGVVVVWVAALLAVAFVLFRKRGAHA